MKSRSMLETRAATALIAMVVLLGFGIMGCGADDDEPASGDEVSKSASSRPSDPSTDGRLTSRSGKVITDYGTRSDRAEAVRTLDRLQRDFRAGRMAAACSRINDFLLGQFTPGATSDQTSCPRKLEAYAAERDRRGDREERFRLLWVRTYAADAGVWVDEPGRGEPLRIQMTLEIGGGWRFDLGAMNRPDILAARLVGAGKYQQR